MKRREHKRMVAKCPYRYKVIFCMEKINHAYDAQRCHKAPNGYFETCPNYINAQKAEEEQP